jgi:hypothetical protein
MGQNLVNSDSFLRINWLEKFGMFPELKTAGRIKFKLPGAQVDIVNVIILNYL